MDLESVTTLIDSIGFPIVACGALFWWLVTISKQQVKMLDQLKQSIDKNSQLINHFLERGDK